MASPLWAKCLPVAPCTLGHGSAKIPPQQRHHNDSLKWPCLNTNGDKTRAAAELQAPTDAGMHHRTLRGRASCVQLRCLSAPWTRQAVHTNTSRAGTLHDARDKGLGFPGHRPRREQARRGPVSCRPERLASGGSLTKNDIKGHQSLSCGVFAFASMLKLAVHRRGGAQSATSCRPEQLASGGSLPGHPMAHLGRRGERGRAGAASSCPGSFLTSGYPHPRTGDRCLQQRRARQCWLVRLLACPSVPCEAAARSRKLPHRRPLSPMYR